MHSPVQWIFNKGWDSQAGGQHLHAVISAAHDLVDKPAEEILAMAVAELGRALPRVRQARLVHGKVVKEKRATFSAAPGLDAIRPSAAGAIPNLFLAGDWCRSGWPATMEGATRSGYLAAAAVLGAGQLAPDLPPSPLYRALTGLV
jgi:zeta-carotene desaturase